jgi:predicted phosphodiesterase
MLYAIISDIHSNLEALQAVLRFLRRKPIRYWLVLGDIVGYGASPNEVVRLVQGLRRRFVVRGNHDRVAAGLDTWEDFNEVAARAIQWTRQKLHPAIRGFLRQLPIGPLPVPGGMVITHGCPRDEDAYVLEAQEALLNFEVTEAPIIWFGHTHIPIIYRQTRSGKVQTIRIPCAHRVRIRLRPGERYMINPGSVGQPRDHCPLTSFCVMNPATWTVTYYRLPYDIAKAQARILRAGLPAFLAQRLAYGL